METNLLAKLICLSCRRPSLKQAGEQLLCSVCGETVPLNKDIPDFFSKYPKRRLTWKLTDDPYRYEASGRQVEAYTLDRVDRPILQCVSGDVLDIGCGTGRLAAAAQARCVTYIGLDPIMSFLSYAQEFRGVRRLVCGQAELLPFHDAAFDCAISTYRAYRYVEPRLGLSEARRVLKTGSIFAFDIYNHWLAKLVELKDSVLAGNWRKLRSFSILPGEDVSDFINLSLLEKRAKAAGFGINKVITTPVLPRFSGLNKYISNYYYRGKKTLYLGYNVIIFLKAI